MESLFFLVRIQNRKTPVLGHVFVLIIALIETKKRLIQIELLLEEKERLGAIVFYISRESNPFCYSILNGLFSLL